MSTMEQRISHPENAQIDEKTHKTYELKLTSTETSLGPVHNSPHEGGGRVGWPMVRPG